MWTYCHSRISGQFRWWSYRHRGLRDGGTPYVWQLCPYAPKVFEISFLSMQNPPFLIFHYKYCFAIIICTVYIVHCTTTITVIILKITLRLVLLSSKDIT